MKKFRYLMASILTAVELGDITLGPNAWTMLAAYLRQSVRPGDQLWQRARAAGMPEHMLARWGGAQ